VEKKKYELCLEVLGRFQKAGILNNIILIGSWCLYFYHDYFSGLSYTPSIRTRDIDFLVPLPPKFKKKIDIPKLLEDLGFIVEFIGSKGCIRLGHPELIVEFLVPERGRQSDKPFPLPQIGLNAQPLRFLDFLAGNTIEVNFHNSKIRLPHPAAFALHKLIIHSRRTKTEKAIKDKAQALMLLDLLLKKGETKALQFIFAKMPAKWRKNVLAVLEKLDETVIFDILKGN